MNSNTREEKRKIPTMVWFLDNEWQEGDGLPGPSYRRKYGVDPGGPEAMGETQSEWNARIARNEVACEPTQPNKQED